MADYEPLDISAHYNTDAGVLGEDSGFEPGAQDLRGLPFLVGDGDSPAADCLIAFDGESGGVTIPIGKPARRVVVAHRMMESVLHSGGPLGAAVADYVFRLAGGMEVRIPLRERFEISPLQNLQSVPGVPGSPFLAVADSTAGLMPRREGEWDQMGRRQMEGVQEWPRWFYLWAWTNPEPGGVVESLEIVPAGPSFVLAGITLGHLDEHPFARQGRRPARIVLKDPDAAAKPFDVDVSVDRGDATYVFPLPQAPDEEFLEGALKGWGEVENFDSSPSYVEIRGVPSATVEVKQGGETVGEANWGEVVDKGAVETPRMRVELAEPGKNWVHVTILDDDTGKPVPCRVHFRSPEGVPYQPHGHHNQVNSNLGTWHVDIGGDARLGQITYAYVDGTCQGWLPRGEVIVDVARGFEYEPLRTKVNIEPGQRDLTLRLKRWTDMKAQGWYSGDSHVHFLSTQGAHTESQGEDLDVVNLLQSQWGSLFTNTEDFTGHPSVSRDGDNIVYVSQENRQHFMGHTILWGLKRPVMPWCSDGLGEAELGGPMETTLSHWADEAHAQGGYVINPHFPYPNGEPAAMIATGRLDGIEMLRQTEFNHAEYYRYLNCGYRIPLVGGTDKMSSDVPVGMYRTYARLADDEEFTYDSWCRSVAAGRTILSGGPIVNLTVDGKRVGDTLNISGPGTVEVEAWAESIFPLHRLEIVSAGRVVASTESSKGTRRLELRERIAVDGHTWLAARCGGPGYFSEGNISSLSGATYGQLESAHFDAWRRGIFAHTSPVYVACGGDWWMFDPATAQYMLTLIEGDLEYIRHSSTQADHGSVTHHHGEGDHVAYLERPFHEARTAIHERMHKHGVSL